MENHESGQITELWRKVKSHVWRIIYLVSVLAFFLPFLSIKGCQGSEYEEYRGFELVSKHTLLVLPIGMGLLFFILSFLRRHGSLLLQGFLESGKAVLALLAGLTVVALPSFEYIFDDIHPGIGQLLSTACWCLVYISSLIGALTYLFEIGPPQTIPRAEYRKRVFPLLMANYFLVGLVTIGPFTIVFFQNMYMGFFLFIWTSSAIALLLLLHFVIEGLKKGETWTGIWCILISLLFLIGGVSSSYFIIQMNALLWLLIPIPISFAVAIILLKSVQFSLDNHKL